MTHMNQDIKVLWLGALRDGKRVQGRGRLKNHNGTFCCLGVLCDIYLESQGLVWDGVGPKGIISGTEWSLPSFVREWADLPVSDPSVIFEEGSPTPLSVLNDKMCMSFAQIADLIEAQL